MPAARDATEMMRAEHVKATTRLLDRMGELPPKPPGHEDILDRAQVSINPHESIHAMVHTLEAGGIVLDQLGIGVLRNRTAVPFLTSDNPVIWFDPSVPEESMRPYVLEPGGPIVLLFPIAPDLLIFGSTLMRDEFSRYGFHSGDVADPEKVETMNRQICRFGYRAIFSRDGDEAEFVAPHCDVAPVLEAEVMRTANGEMVRFLYAFGRRQDKAKWKNRRS